MSRVIPAICFVLIWVPCVHAARDVEFNVDFFCGWDGYYRPMEWTPVEIGVGSDLKEPFAGSFTISAQQDGLNTLNVIHTFVLTPDVPVTMPLVTKFAFAPDKCNLSIRDERGRTQWQLAINMWDYSIQNRLLRPVQEQDLLIGLVGQAQFGVLRLARDTACMSSRGRGKVYVGSKVPRAVPWDWTGFVCLDLLVLFDPDWTLLKPQQLQAICDWVSNGGTTLLILGQHPLPSDSPLSELLPFHLGDPRQVEIPAQALERWGLDSDRTEVVMAWPLFPKPQALVTRKVEAPGGGYLHGVGYTGFGRLAVLGFDPAELSDEQAGRTAEFWTRHIAACISNSPESEDTASSGSQPGNAVLRGRTIVLAEDLPDEDSRGGNPNDNRYMIGIAQNASNQVMDHLYALKQMQPLSIWWVILTLTALAVLLGPVDYLVLKRLDKLPYTWLTSTGWIVIFTVGAYYGVQWLRSGAMELRVVSVLDSVAEGNCAWGTSYAGLFAPRSDDYRIEGLKPNQWWSGISPSRDEFWAYQQEAGMRQIHCLQADGGNLPVSLPVNIWTVQSLLSEWNAADAPFAATVERDGDNAIAEIRNTSASRIRGGYILFDDACANLGPVPANSSQRFELRTRPFRSWQPSGSVNPPQRRGRRVGGWPGVDVPRYPTTLSGSLDSAFLAQGCLPRTMAMHTCLRLGVALVCVVYEDAPLPFGIEDHSCAVNHVQFARQLVRIAD